MGNVRYRCMFCGREITDDVIAIKGIKATDFICENCVKQCFYAIDGVEKRQNKKEPASFGELKTPMEIKEFLDQYVIGQEDAKRTLATAVYNHYKRLYATDNETTDVELQKSNILIMGPSGTGKTLLAKSLAKILDVPFAIADATTLTEAGYVGDDVENILVRLIQAADGDIERAERGIVYIDEIDKIARKSESASITRDVSGEGVQQALLKIIEGTEASVPIEGGRKHPNGNNVMINTSNILFICGGAFVGMDKVIEEKKNSKKIGFTSETTQKEEAAIENITSENLVKYGLIPELVGRIPVVTTLNKLDEKALVSILTKPKDAIIKQYKELFRLDGVELDFTEEAIHEIAKLAIKEDTGARGLRTIVEKTLAKPMFEIPSDKSIYRCEIHSEHIGGKKEPIVKKKDKKVSA